MSDLFETQREVARALMSPGPPAGVIADCFTGDADQVARRLAIYRGNIRAAGAKALAAAYPVIGQVVGEEYFDGLARAYQRAVPSTSGDLGHHGAGLADFIAGFEPARSLPYLPDLARLEWAVHRAYGAEDAGTLDQAALAQVTPERQTAIRFRWAAGTQVIRSPFPIARIWTIHQAGFDADFKVDWSAGECARVAREGLRVTVQALAPGDASFIARSLAGEPLGSCAAAALAVDPGFDLGALLAQAVASKLICGFHLDGEPNHAFDFDLNHDRAAS